MSRNALSNEQFRELVSQVVHGIPSDLSVEDYDYLMAHGKERDAAIAETLRTLRTRVQPVERLLEAVTTATTKAIKLFKPEETIIEGKRDGVSVAFVSDNFKQVMRGKVETDVPEAILRVHQLRKTSVDGPIIAELGGEEVAETTFVQMWDMVKAQGRGQKGKLLTNDYANIFYIRDANGVLWTVDCDWRASDDGWRFYADPIAFPSAWGVGGQVVSR